MMWALEACNCTLGMESASLAFEPDMEHLHLRELIADSVGPSVVVVELAVFLPSLKQQNND